MGADEEQLDGLEIADTVRIANTIEAHGGVDLLITLGTRGGYVTADFPEQLRRLLTWDQGTELAQHALLRIDTRLQRESRASAARKAS